MFRLPIRSRRGNQMLAVLGLLFVLSSSWLLTIALSQTWSFAGKLDYALMLILAFTIACGVAIFLGARKNLVRDAVEQPASARQDLTVNGTA